MTIGNRVICPHGYECEYVHRTQYFHGQGDIVVGGDYWHHEDERCDASPHRTTGFADGVQLVKNMRLSTEQVRAGGIVAIPSMIGEHPQDYLEGFRAGVAAEV